MPEFDLGQVVGPRGPQGVKGDTGEQGVQGIQGVPGNDGVTPNIQVGEVTTLPAGSHGDPAAGKPGRGTCFRLRHPQRGGCGESWGYAQVGL